MSEKSGPFFPIVQVDEIAFAMAFFVSAASLQIPPILTQKASSPHLACAMLFRALTETMPPLKIQGTAEVEGTLEYAFTALWMQYEGDVRQRSICARVLGFHRLMVMSRGALVADWVTSPEDTPEVVLLHSAVVEAVAMARLSESGEMLKPEFLKALQLIAAEDLKQAA